MLNHKQVKKALEEIAEVVPDFSTSSRPVKWYDKPEYWQIFSKKTRDLIATLYNDNFKKYLIPYLYGTNYALVEQPSDFPKEKLGQIAKRLCELTNGKIYWANEAYNNKENLKPIGFNGCKENIYY